uniref:StAR-related lipid transfer protein 9 n=1 Tax=Sus scrofa TaxID=9823 RepID=A0A8D0Z4U7_PIG
MANVRVAVRVRPLSKRETKEGGRIIVEVDGRVAKIRNLKVFQDLGTEVLSGAAKGYNICLFAYGQTGSGKTYTMLGTPASVGLTPRICEGLFIREDDCTPLPSSCRIKVSFLEIYNERVRDLLKQSDQKKSYTLRVREHPEMGPYVQGLSQHVVTNYKQVIQLLEEGIANRITAATHVHEASSRSHAIFTIYYTQAILENNLPSEIASKINLVDLAGSERADPSYCKDRLTEGANINKSLVTLGIVISTLAQNSQVFSSCQSFSSSASDGGNSGVPSSPSGTSSDGGRSRRQSYIPYRDSVLTWLLKDSLGGNSRTIMVATVSPAHTSYSETMSTLRYASNAKNIINKPRVNEDANVKLIRELRDEIGRLKAMLLSFELRNFHSLNEGKEENLKELVLQNELKIDQLTKDWTRKWDEWKALVEHYRVDINRRRAGLVIDSSLPHLMALEDDVLSTGVVLYHLKNLVSVKLHLWTKKEGTTKIGRIDSDQEQDIVLQGQWIERDHCTITSACGVVILRPARGARCSVNGREVTASCRLTQGAVIILGKAQKFRFNHPAEAAILRQQRQVGEAVGGSGSLEWLDLDGDVTASRLGLCPLLWKESPCDRRALGEQIDEDHRPPRARETPHRSQVQQQHRYLGDVRQRILVGQIRAQQEPELVGASAGRQIKEDHQWLLREETWLPQQDHVAEKELEAPVPSDSWCQTDPETQPFPRVRSQKRLVHPQLLRKHALRVAEQKVKWRRASFQLERIVKRQRLLEAHRRPEQLRALCWLQDDHPRRPLFQAPNPGALVSGPQCRSTWTRCSSLSLRRPCGQHSAQLRSVFLNQDSSTTLPPLPDPTDQLSEKIPSEEYVPQAASYPPRMVHFSKHALCSSGEEQLCTAKKGLVKKRASAPGTCLTTSSGSASDQQIEGVALTEPLKLEEPQRKEQDLPEPENSESDDSQISADSLAEKGYQSPQDSPGDSYLTLGRSHLRARAQASVKGFTTSSGSGLLTQTHRSFSLDSLIGAEEELGDDQQEEPFLSAGAADEMPAETFWHLQTFSLPTGDKEAACRLGSVSHRTGARLDTVLPVSGSFYLEPQPRCEQPELVVEASSSEQAVQLSRGSPLVSMDSWFSCDSKINPSSPPDSLCPSPNGQDFQPCGWERPGYWRNMEALKSSGTETALPHSPGAEPPSSVRGVYPVPASNSSRLSLWGSSRLLQPGVEGTFQARSVSDPAQQGFSEASSSSGSSLLAASATSFTYVGSTRERDWAALQQKYLLELSFPVLEATGEPRPVCPSLQEDSGSLTQVSGRGGDAVLPVGPGVSGSLDVNSSPVHLSKIRRLRAEKEQDSLSVEVEGTSDFFTTSEKEVSYSGAYSADVESSTSGATNARVSAAESRIEHSMMEAPEVKQNSLEVSSQSSEKPGPITSSDECFVLKNPCHHIVTIATKDPHWPQAEQLGQNSHPPSQDEKTDSQESSKEAGERRSRLSFTFPSGPELYLHSAPWNPLPSSLQPPPLETFYVTKSRDALTETALEIPAFREVRIPSPPAREAWGFSHEHQVLQNVYMKKKSPVLLPNSKITSSQQVTEERPIDLTTKQVCREKGERPGNVEEESHNSVYFFVTQNRHFLPSTEIKIGEFENEAGILNKHRLPTLKPGEKAYCSVSSSSCGSREPLLCESEADKEEEQGQNAVFRQSQAFDTKRQCPSGFRSDFIHRTFSLGLDKDMQGEDALPLKSRLVHHRVSSPETSAQDERPAHKGEGKNEPKLLRKALHPRDSSRGFKLPQAKSAFERLHSVTCSQERSLGERMVPAKPQETWLNPKEEPPGKKRNKRVNNADEMARLIRSVMQLENSILEMESRQSKQLCASYTLGVSGECVSQDQKHQEMANDVLRPGSSGNHQSFKDQPSALRGTADVTFGDGEAGEVEVHSRAGKDPQVCDARSVRGHTYPAVLDSPTGDTLDHSGICTVFREPTGTGADPRRTKAPAGAVSSQPRPQRTSEAGRQSCGLGSLEALEVAKGFQESQPAKGVYSSKQDELKIQGRIEEMVVSRGSLHEGNRVVSLTHKLPGPCQHWEDTFFSQESSLLLSQPDSCTAPRQDLSNTLPLNSARLPRSYPHAPDAIGIPSVVYVLDPTMLKMPTSPLVTGVRCQDQSGDPGCHGPRGDIGGVPSVAHPAWAGSVISMAAGSHGQSSAPESITLGAEGRRSESTSPQDHRGDFRSTSMGLSSRAGSPSEAETAVQRGPERASSLNRASGPLERRAGCPLEEGSTRGLVMSQKVEEEAKDPGPTCGFFSAPASLRQVPQPEPSARPPSRLVVLGEMGQAEAQRKQPHDVVTRGTVLCYSETLLEPEGSSGAPGRPQHPQMSQSMSDRARHEGEAQGLHVAPLSAEPGHLSIDERTSVLQATPPSTDSFCPLLNADTHPGPQCPSRPSSRADPALGKSHRNGKLEHFLGAGEQSVCHSTSFEMIEQKEATRRSSADPLGSNSLPPSAAVEEARRVKTEGVEAALASQAPCDDAGGIPRGGGQSTAHQEAAEDVSSGGQESSPVQQEPGTLDNMREGGPGNFLMSAQGRKPTSLESHQDVQNPGSLSGPNQGQVQCLEPPTGLEGRVSPKQGIVLPGALRGVEPEAPLQQRVKQEGSVSSGPAEDCRASGEGPRPIPLLAPSPGAVREDTPHRCLQQSPDSVVFLGSTGGGRTLGPSGGLGGSKSHPPQHLCSPQPIASQGHASPSSDSLCYRGGDLGSWASKAAPHMCHSPCMGASRGWGVDKRGERHCRDPDMLLGHDLEPKDINVELGPADSSPLEPPAAAADLPLAQGCSSPSAPDVRTGSLSCSVADGSSRSVGNPEKKLEERKASTELEAAAFRTGRSSEPPRGFQDSCAGGQSAQGSQPKPQQPSTAGGQHSEPLVGPQHGCLGNTISCLPEKTQLSTEFRDHRGLDPKAKYVAKFKYIPSPQADSPWEEEEQQRDWASGGGEDPAWNRSPPPPEEDSSDIRHIGGTGREQMAEARPPVSKTLSSGCRGSATVPLEQCGAPQPVARVPAQASSGGDQPAPHHRCALPVLAVFSGPEHLRPQFSVISSSRSLQKLNLSVEPPSLTDEDVQEPSRLWTPLPGGSSSGMSSVARPSVKTEGCDQGASGDLDKSTADPRHLPPAPPPHPGMAHPPCVPTPNFTASQLSGSLEQAWPGEPERLGAQARPGELCSGAGTEDLLFGSSDIHPRVLPWHPAGPERVGWKQCVFGGMVDVSRGCKSQCCNTDGVEGQDSAFHSCPSTCASACGLASTHSTENTQGSHQAWKVWGSSFALGNPYALASSGGTAPTKGPNKRVQFLGSPGEAGCLRKELPLTEGSAVGPVDEVMMLCPSEAHGPVGPPGMSTLEQGTQTLGSGPHGNHPAICCAQSDAASWASMHSLSLRLSQLLHSTSELLGSLSQPSVAEREWNTKRETPDEAPQALMMDSCTQTTMDEGIQTDLASPPLHLQAPEANPQKVDVVLEGLGPDISITSQEKGHVLGTLEKREAEETVRKTVGLQDLQEESTQCRSRSPLEPSSHLSFWKGCFGQNLPSLSPQASPDASPPPSSQPEEPSSLAGSSPGTAPPSKPCTHTLESLGEPRVLKKQGLSSALLVDRASSPILTLSAHTQGLGLPSGALCLSTPLAHSLEGHQKLISSPSLPLYAPRPPMGNSQATDESADTQRVGALCGEGKSSSEGGDRRPSQEVSSQGSPRPSAKLQVRFVEQPPREQQQQQQPGTTTGGPSRLRPPPTRSQTHRLALGFGPEDTASLECGPLSSRGPSQRWSRTENGCVSSASPAEPRPALHDSFSWEGLQRHSPCPFSEVTHTPGLQGYILGPTEACQPEGPLHPSSRMCMDQNLRDLPMHNKFSDWCGVQDGSPREPGVMDLPGTGRDCGSGEQGQRPAQPPDDQSQAEWSKREQIPLQVGARSLSLSVELTEAKLHHGFGETDALLQVLQSGTGEALTAEEEPRTRSKQAMENLPRERAGPPQSFRRTRSLSPQKQPISTSHQDLLTRDLDLPSRRREYLQRLRRDVVETTRNPRSASRSAHPPSDIELMLQEYQRAREEARVEIARARDRLRERTEQEKLRIRQQIVSQLLQEEEKLHTLATSSSRCTSSDGSLSSGVTSGYNSSPALPGQLQSPDIVADTNSPDSRDAWLGDVRGRSAGRNSQPNLAGAAWRSLVYSRRASLGSWCCSPSSLSSLGTSFSSSYKDLAKHIVDISMADVMAACSDNLNNLFSRQAAAGWNHQGEEQEVQLYYKVFSSTRHGFLGAGVVSQPLSHVWAAVSDPTLWPLYHKPIQTARLHQRVTNNINLVYLVCNTTLCALKQPRDFCCVCVEAKEGQLSVMAAQSVYDASMPRPSKEVVRGEILPSAWILQPLTVEGKEITRVIYLAQVELGAPGFPPQVLSAFIKQQPLVIARLASFLGS